MTVTETEVDLTMMWTMSRGAKSLRPVGGTEPRVEHHLTKHHHRDVVESQVRFAEAVRELHHGAVANDVDACGIVLGM